MLISIEMDITCDISRGPDPLSPPLDPCMTGLGYGRFWKPRKHSLSAHHQKSFWIVEWHFCWGADDSTVLCLVVYWELIGEFHYK